MTYDVHAHCIPPRVIEAIRAGEDDLGVEIGDDGGRGRLFVAGTPGRMPLHPGLADLDARIAAMDTAGVTVQLLSSWIDLTAYALPPDQGERLARLFNAAVAEMVMVTPDRFRGLCTVPLQAPERAAAVLRQAVTELSMVGVEIATTVDGRELDDPGLDPFWAAAAELRCLVLLHPLDSLAGRGVRRHFLSNMVGNPAETTIAVGHVVYGGVLQRYPELRICVVHGGGFVPYQAGRIARGYVARPDLTATVLSEPPEASLRRLYFDTVLHDPQAVAALVAFAGVEHVVMGSDYPFEMGDPDPVGTIAKVPGLTEAERTLILRGNVERLINDLTIA
ncbi:MAG TPA: amidohydrolase family protein [Euzebyales bacterium]|nr:amidohydrolase family protein [Euzebyales bacterium]